MEIHFSWSLKVMENDFPKRVVTLRHGTKPLDYLGKHLPHFCCQLFDLLCMILDRGIFHNFVVDAIVAT